MNNRDRQRLKIDVFFLPLAVTKWQIDRSTTLTEQLSESKRLLNRQELEGFCDVVCFSMTQYQM